MLLGGCPADEMATSPHDGSDGKESVCSAGDQVRSLGQEDPLEKEMTTHSVFVPGVSLWTEEPGRLQSMGVANSGT